MASLTSGGGLAELQTVQRVGGAQPVERVIGHPTASLSSAAA